MAQVVDMVVQKSEWITRGFLEQRVVAGANSERFLFDDHSNSLFNTYTFVQRLDVRTCPLQHGWLERWTRPLVKGAVVVSPAGAASNRPPSCEIQNNAMFKTGQQLNSILLQVRNLNMTGNDAALCAAATQLYGPTDWLARPLS